jgi:bifunctional non-homologous end joining protein LigD
MTTPIKPALCKLAVAPHNKEGWVWERKYDGVRMVVTIDGGVHLQARSGTDKTAQFPELVEWGLTNRCCILDGEVVSATNLTFQQFAQRRVNRTSDIAEAARKWPAIFVAFDIIEVGGKSIAHYPLSRRLDAMHDLIYYSPTIIHPEWSRSGTSLFATAQRQGWEGVVGKRLDEPYQFGKRAWLKVKVWQEGVYLVSGFTQGKGKRGGYWEDGAVQMAGSFQLSDQDTGEPVGSVGTGFSSDELKSLTRLVKEHPTNTIRFRVKYVEKTNSGQLRFPVYIGIAKPLPDALRRTPEGSK